MPLSEHEQRLLEQMERALYAEDPKFASTLRGGDPRSNFRRRVVLAGLGFLIGIVALMTGLVAQVVLVSILGFVLMLASAFFVFSSWRRLSQAPQLGVVTGTGQTRQPAARVKASRPKRGFMARMEERWDRRKEQGGQ